MFLHTYLQAESHDDAYRHCSRLSLGEPGHSGNGAFWLKVLLRIGPIFSYLVFYWQFRPEKPTIKYSGTNKICRSSAQLRPCRNKRRVRHSDQREESLHRKSTIFPRRTVDLAPHRKVKKPSKEVDWASSMTHDDMMTCRNCGFTWLCDHILQLYLLYA